MPTVSIIIPHWNGIEHLNDCLGALRRQSFTDHEIILVDNGSQDGSQAFVRVHFPEVRLIELGENRGFTGACNAGYAAAGGRYILLLNNDTAADPDWVTNIVEAFERHPEVGAVASKIRLFDPRDRLHTAGDFYRLDGIPGNRGVWLPDLGQYDREEPVFSACGGAAGYRRTMLEQIGFLDSAFFFSCEDVDLSWRAQLAGWEVLYVPTALVYHKLKASDSGATASYYDGRNFLYVIWKNYPGSILRRTWPLVLRAQVRLFLQALRAWRGRAARARLHGQFAGVWGLPKMLRKRRQIQRTRRITDEQLLSRLSPVDDDPAHR
jgi:GT2 family glycosyltransferase